MTRPRSGIVLAFKRDDKFFWPILERAEALNVPIYLHSAVPPKAVVEASFGGFTPSVSAKFAAGGWGWHIETAVHLIRMILGGVFDWYPRLQIVIGHLGEGIPFVLPRLQKELSNGADEAQSFARATSLGKHPGGRTRQISAIRTKRTQAEALR